MLDERGRKFTEEETEWCVAKLTELAPRYAGQLNGGLRGAVRDGKITEKQRSLLSQYIDWDLA